MLPKRIIVIGITVLLVGLVSRVPASVGLRWALPDTIKTQAISGTIWRGEINALQANGITIAPMKWTLQPLALLTGKLRLDVDAGLPGGFFAGVVEVGSNSVEVIDAKAMLALAPITRLSSIGPSNGEARLTIQRARFESGWPVAVDGQVVLNNLKYPPISKDTLGNYQLQFLPAMASAAFPVGAELSSVAGPYQLDGTIQLGPQRSYAMRGTIGLQPGSPQAYQNALRMLGPADAGGNHTLRFDGNF